MEEIHYDADYMCLIVPEQMNNPFNIFDFKFAGLLPELETVVDWCQAQHFSGPRKMLIEVI